MSKSRFESALYYVPRVPWRIRIHCRLKKHKLKVFNPSVPLWDPSAKGIWAECGDCPKTWAL